MHARNAMLFTSILKSEARPRRYFPSLVLMRIKHVHEFTNRVLWILRSTKEATKEAEQYTSELKTLIKELDKAFNKTHEVTLTGSISTTVTIKAKDEEEAIAKAHADFQKNLGDAHDYVDWLEETVEEVEA